MGKFTFNFTIGFLLFWLPAFSGSYAQHIHDKNAEVHSHNHRNEVGIAGSPVWLLNEKELAFGFHTHVIHYFDHSRFGIGLGYERIFDEHSHQNVGIVGSFRFFNNMSLNLSPGISFESLKEPDISLTLHAEVLYEFVIDHLHIGPILQYAIGYQDQHVSFGLHIGLGF